MDPNNQGAGALDPLFARVVGDPVLAAIGGDELDRVMKATEVLVAEITAKAKADVEIASSVIRHQSDQAVAHRRLELHGLRSELLDRATGLALRFEALLDDLDGADFALAQIGADGPPLADAPTDDDEVAAIRKIVQDRQRIAVAPGDPQPVVFGHPQGSAEPIAGEAVQRRRWWHRLLGEAA